MAAAFRIAWAGEKPAQGCGDPAVKQKRSRVGLLTTAATILLVASSFAACGSPAATSTPSSPSTAVAIVPDPATAAAGSLESPPPKASPATATASASPTAMPAPPGSAVLVGAGDICQVFAIANALHTATLVEALPSAGVFTLGDNSNDSGTAEQYATCYGSTWGAFKSRTRPTAGNHDYLTSAGAPYYAYFGSAAGPAGKGYYSYDLAANWHVIVLNAICAQVGGCGSGSAQESWLRADLAANPDKHVIAMWHIPRFSSGLHGGSTDYQVWWQDLYDAHAEIVLNGHDHEYERFAPQSPTGVADRSGMREFVVGTGGAALAPFLIVKANSEVRRSGTCGVLKLTLTEHSYAWQFMPVAGSSFTDSGETATHD
jgi:hypothetical protein